MSLSLEHIDACLPLTGLKALRLGKLNAVIQGQGPYSQLIHSSNGSLLAEIRTFKRNNVHGFLIIEEESVQRSSNSAQILVWGGQSVRLIKSNWSVDNNDNATASLSAGSAEFQVPDWILCGCSIRTSEGIRAFLVTAHNALLGLSAVEDAPSKYQRRIYVRQLVAGAKSILYSADVSAVSNNHILIAAGTVFGEIIVWSCFLDGRDLSSCRAMSSIHYFFTGHEGSIFGVSISQPIASLHGFDSCLLLASCSDDRTVRIWDISDSQRVSPRDPSAYSTDGFELRSTGFGAVGAGNEKTVESCIVKAFGHGARIWGVRFLPYPKTLDSSVGLVTHGEDAACIFWALVWERAACKSRKFVLREVSSVRCHSGKHIWSIDTSVERGITTVFTGGSDGALKTTKVVAATSNILEVSKIKSSILAPHKNYELGTPSKNSKSALKSFSFVARNCFLAVSFGGEVQLGFVDFNMQTGDTHSAIRWEFLCVEDDLRSFSIMGSFPRRGLALLGNGRGLIRLYNHKSKSLFAITQAFERPLTLLALDSCLSSNSQEQALHFVVSYATLEKASLFMIESWDSEPLSKSVTLSLPHGFCVWCASFILNNEYLMLGSKCGALAIYKISYSETVLQPAECIRRVHGFAGVNQITRIAPSSMELADRAEYFMTCGRDGSYCVHEFQASTCPKQIATLRTVHKSSASSIPNIEGFFFDESAQDLMLYGFNDRKFVLCNESAQTELVSFECGGARRNWAFNAENFSEFGGLFLWNQSAEFYIQKIRPQSHRVLRAGGHGREIKCMAVYNCSNEKRTLIATGAEDTTVRIFVPTGSKIDGPWGSFKCLRILNKHRSGLQHLGWSKDGEYLFTCSGFEEFFVWSIRSVPKFGIATMLLGESPKDDEKSDLRVTGFDVLNATEHGSRRSFLICLIYSNSTLRIFHFSLAADQARFFLLAKGTYMANCLTQVKFIVKDSSIHLLTAATDGYFTLWNLTPALSLFYCIDPAMLTLETPLYGHDFAPEEVVCENRYQTHLNSVKSMDVVDLSASESLVVCGGDDNSVSVSVLRLPYAISKDEPRVLTISVPDAHAASITAVKILYASSSNSGLSGEADDRTSFTVASSGNDHRVKLWSISINPSSSGPDGILIRNLLDEYASVADISSLDLIYTRTDGLGPTGAGLSSFADTSRRLLVCGVGMELLEFALVK